VEHCFFSVFLFVRALYCLSTYGSLRGFT